LCGVGGCGKERGYMREGEGRREKTYGRRRKYVWVWGINFNPLKKGNCEIFWRVISPLAPVQILAIPQ